MTLFSKRKRIIKKAVSKTVDTFAERTPAIYEHFFFGSYDSDAHNLAVWYLFETDSELAEANNSGLCKEIEELTIRNLISLGYPCEAFEHSNNKLQKENVISRGVDEEDVQNILFSLSNRKAAVAFASQEDVDRKADGDYRLYFQ